MSLRMPMVRLHGVSRASRRATPRRRDRAAMAEGLVALVALAVLVSWVASALALGMFRLLGLTS